MHVEENYRKQGIYLVFSVLYDITELSMSVWHHKMLKNHYCSEQLAQRPTFVRASGANQL